MVMGDDDLYIQALDQFEQDISSRRVKATISGESKHGPYSDITGDIGHVNSYSREVICQSETNVSAPRQPWETAPTQQSGAGDFAEVNLPICLCGEPALLLTARTEKNSGRQFFKCGKQGLCAFFKWADEVGTTGASGGGTPGSGPRTGPAAGPGAVLVPTGSNPVMCNCGVPAIGKVAKTAKNMDRPFWRCATDKECGFFQWTDEAGPAASPGKPGSAGRSPGQGLAPGQPGSQGSYPGTARALFPPGGSQNTSPAAGPSFGSGASLFGPPTSGGGGGPAASFASNAPVQDRGNDACFKCGQVGHWASQCPNGGGGGSTAGGAYGGDGGGAAGGGNRSNDACFKCGQVGHWSSQCPNGPAAKGGSYGGGGGGDYGAPFGAGGAPYGGGGGGGGGSASRDRDICFRCGQTGHWSSQCPNGGAGGATYGGGAAGAMGTAGGGGGNACFKCGLTGHWASQCPNSGAGAAYGGGRGGGGGGGYGGGGRTGGGLGGGGGSCFRCGQPGHMSYDCPLRG